MNTLDTIIKEEGVTDEIIGQAFLTMYLSAENSLRNVGLRRLRELPEALKYLPKQQWMIERLGYVVRRVRDEALYRTQSYESDRQIVAEDLRELNRHHTTTHPGSERTIDERLRTICNERMFANTSSESRWEDEVITDIGFRIRTAILAKQYDNPAEIFYAITERLFDRS